MSSPFEQSDDLPVYVISVAAELSGMHPQTLREYERRGLVSPGRSAGRGRRYSMRDILALREIQRLSKKGVNLAGVKLLLDQLQEQEEAQALIADLRAEITQLRAELESTRAVAARLAGLLRSGGTDQSGLVPVRHAPRAAGWDPVNGPAGGAGDGK